MTTDDTDDAPPWEIPIRDPDPRLRGSPGTGLGQAIAVLAFGVVAFTAAMVFGAGALVEDDDPRDEPDPGTRTEVAAETTERDGATPRVTAPTSTPGALAAGRPASTVASDATSSTTTTSTTTATAASGAAAPGTGSVPPLPSWFTSGWVAQLSSIPTSAGTSRLETAWERVNDQVPDAVVAVSDDWATFRPGYWVLVEPGPFDSSAAVRAFCDDVDGECVPRQITGG